MLSCQVPLRTSDGEIVKVDRGVIRHSALIDDLLKGRAFPHRLFAHACGGAHTLNYAGSAVKGRVTCKFAVPSSYFLALHSVHFYQFEIMVIVLFS